MLRFGFLPSDFHPLVLILGEAGDLCRFAVLLRRFAEDPQDIQLRDCGICLPADDTAILLTAAGAEPGMRPVADRPKTFTWTVEPWQAEMFAEDLEALAQPGRKSGSALLECESIGEIPVKVSLGEFTDDFLLPGAA
jgi:hypothetical protein